MKMSRFVFAAALVVLVGAARQAAAETFTSALRVHPSDVVECTALNVGIKPVQILVELRDPAAANGTVFGPGVCANTNPGDICAQELDNGTTDRLVSCKITTKSKKVRAILMNLTTGNSSEAR